LQEIKRVINNLRDAEATITEALQHIDGVYQISLKAHKIFGCQVVVIDPDHVHIVIDHGGGRFLFMDATHALVANGVQLVSVLTLTKYGVMPIGYQLSTGSTALDLRCILENLRDLGVSGDIWMVDFDRAELNAITSVFPHAIVRGCYFHFVQGAARVYVVCFSGFNF
jgi:hypothetical protein